MKKNIILVLLMSISLVIFYGCANPSASGSQDTEDFSTPKTGCITISANEGNDFSLTKSESNGKVVLTAAQGYSDYKWYLDADFTVKSENAEYSFVPANGVTMIFVTAKKDGMQCSATYYVTKTMKM